jgi:hypothetical protein
VEWCTVRQLSGAIPISRKELTDRKQQPKEGQRDEDDLVNVIPAGW